jgi:hypothetical protein
MNGNTDAAPRDCSALKARANEILFGALETLGTSTEQWQAAGLPLPVMLKHFTSEQEGE